MGGFNNFGVPYYAHPDTPAIRPREMPKSESKSESWQNMKAEKMKAIRYVREFIKAHWKEGDRFVLSKEKNIRGDCSQFPGASGVFTKIFLCGSVWMVRVVWDDPSLGKKIFSMADFYHFGFKPKEIKENNDGLADEST